MAEPQHEPPRESAVPIADGLPSWLATADPGEPGDGAEEVRAAIAEAVEELGDDPPRRWMDLDDVDHFAEVANRIYNELSARLRFDLLVERERAGSLMDRN
ncbi:hypothetical protein [Actinophytocola sp.]|uniref:hypothetical protein n=1 Tax=Actinophytocola sp. TaxID=1872138 RepID=UPI00389AFB09